MKLSKRNVDLFTFKLGTLIYHTKQTPPRVQKVSYILLNAYRAPYVYKCPRKIYYLCLYDDYPAFW